MKKLTIEAKKKKLETNWLNKKNDANASGTELAEKDTKLCRQQNIKTIRV